MIKHLKKICIGMFGFAVLGVSLLVTQSTSASGWPVDISDLEVEHVMLNRDTTISLCHYEVEEDSAGMHLVTTDGNLLSVPRVNGQKINACRASGNHLRNVDSNNYIYGLTYDSKTIVVIDGDQIVRTYELPHCSSHTYAGSLWLDEDDNTYYSFYNHCNNETRLIKINPNNQAETVTVLAASNIGSASIRQHDDGFVVQENLIGGIAQFKIYTYDDLHNPTIWQPDLQPGELIRPQWQLSATGTLSVPVTRAETCGGVGYSDRLKRVIVYDATSGSEVTHSNDIVPCDIARRSTILPDGTTVIALVRGGQNVLAFIEAGGAVRYSPIANPSPNAYSLNESVSELTADEFGNVLVIQRYIVRVDNNTRYDYGHLSLYNSEGSRIGVYSTEPDVLDHAVPLGWVQFSTGMLYVEDQAVIKKIPFSQIGFAYPRSHFYNIQSPPVASKKYVAMGDSYSSGEGVRPFIEGTNVSGGNTCHRSHYAYPMFFADDPLQNISFSLDDFVACSGAKMADVLSVSQHADQPPQIDALDADTDVVTLSIGGNDIDFEAFAIACVVLTCAENTTVYQNSMDLVESELEGEDGLRKVYREVLEEAPNATVYVLDYPYITSLDYEEMLSCPSYFGHIGNGFADAVAAHSLTTALAEAIADAVMDIQQNDDEGHRLRLASSTTANNPFEGHSLCAPIGDRYFHGANIANKQYSFHPNLNGQHAYYRSLRSYVDPN